MMNSPEGIRDSTTFTPLLTSRVCVGTALAVNGQPGQVTGDGAVTAAGAVGFELCARLNDRSLRFGGCMVVLSACLNLGIAYLGLRLGSIFVIALATVGSQSVLALATGCASSLDFERARRALAGRLAAAAPAP